MATFVKWKFPNFQRKATAMDRYEAAHKADKMINLMLQYQPGLVAPSHLLAPDRAKNLAQTLAELRKELTQELMKQDDQDEAIGQDGQYD